ncbi:MAG: GNAT family N-acetyltransferase [Phycisphaerales bacterium]|nr:GNAT family N-acetyltransferase [Phycisphaerales bacterium]
MGSVGFLGGVLVSDRYNIEEAAVDGASQRCEAILRSIPEWFGIEEATLRYIAAAARLPTWIASLGPRDAGFITISRHFDESAEIHCIAVHRDFHGMGAGTALVRLAEEHLRQQGVRYLQVKTLGPSRTNVEYARTLHFYLRRGFARLEEINGLWPGIPCLILVKKL